MTTTIIPTEEAAQDGIFFESVSLDGVDYQLYFKYNSREGFWYFDLNDVEGNPIRTGIKVVVNYPLTFLCACPEKPAGELSCINTEDEPQDPGLNDLGLNALMAYLNEEGVDGLSVQ